jgi:hypothetical protein
MILTGETEGLGEKPVPVPLCPPQITRGLTWAQSWASAFCPQSLLRISYVFHCKQGLFP